MPRRSIRGGMSRSFSRLFAYATAMLYLSATAAFAFDFSLPRPLGPQIVHSSGKCLTSPPDAGSPIVLRSCQLNRVYQQFYLNADVINAPIQLVADMGVEITNVAYCLTVNLSARPNMPPGSLTLEFCKPLPWVQNQRGRPLPAVASNPVLQQRSFTGGAIRRTDNAGCLGAASAAEGTPVLFAPCNGGASQQWTMRQ